MRKSKPLILIAVIILISIACITSSKTPSPADEQIKAGETMVVGLSSDIDAAIVNGDYFVAAINLQKLFGNPGVDEKMESIAKFIPGGLIMEGTPPQFISFTDRSGIEIPNWPQNVSGIQNISPDGKTAMIHETYDNVHSFILTFSDGSLREIDLFETNTSPDQIWGVDRYASNTPSLVNFLTGERKDICSPQNNMLTWSSDSRTLVAMDGNSHSVHLINIPSMDCTEVSLPGLEWDNTVLFSPQTQQLVIILPGSFSAQKHGELLVANSDGSNIKKISDLPIMGREVEGRTFLSPDGSTLYIDGFIVSTKTGAYAKPMGNAIAWVEDPISTSAISDVQLLVSPKSGPRGTRFSFTLTGSSPNQEIVWFVTQSSESSLDQQAYIISNLNSTGGLTDVDGQFGFDTGLQNSAGDYFLHVYIAPAEIASAKFTITEP